MNSLYSKLVAYIPCHHYDDTVGVRELVDLIGGHEVLAPSGSSPGITISSGLGGRPALAWDGTENVGHNTIADYEMGDIDFTIACWAFLSNAADRVMVAKSFNSAGDRDYELWYDNAAANFVFRVFTPTDVAVDVDDTGLGAATLNTWYFVRGFHDATNDLVGIQVNNLAVATAATGGALQAAGAAALEVATRNTGLLRWNGRLQEIQIWKDRLLTGQEHAYLYNNGQGRTFPYGDGRGMPLQHNRRLRRRRVA